MALPEDAEFSEIADTWTQQPGFPVVHVTRDYERGTVTLTQEHFNSSTPRERYLTRVTTIMTRSKSTRKL